MQKNFAEVVIPAPLYPLDKSFAYKIPAELATQINVGSLVEVPFRGRSYSALVTEIKETVDFDESKAKEITSLKVPETVVSSKRLNFLNWQSGEYLCSLGEVFEASIPGPVRKASQKLLVDKIEKPKKIAEAEKKYNLTQEQQAAFDFIKEKKSGTHLLWGITGSGKTEIYLRLIAEALNNNKSALVLVPEIALTPQLFTRFEKRFPGEVAIFHSSQKPLKTRKQWLEVLRKKKKLVIGARSALFAPIEDIGVIVVDEEHDSSYKQEEKFRYHARDSAIKLGEIYNAPVVLGSATPSFETLHNAFSDKFSLSKLTQRAVKSATLPEIKFVDLSKEKAQKSFSSPEEDGASMGKDEGDDFFDQQKSTLLLSQELLKNIKQSLDAKKQCILFLNRRGLGKHIVCSSCGDMPECPTCQIPLTPHGSSTKCHYCGYYQNKLGDCHKCKKIEGYKEIGVGVQKLEEILTQKYPDARILRLDRDSTEKKGSLEEILEKFKNSEADILIGTQMVAKGHDFPNVDLVGIILAEQGLSVPDFRATERTMQLLTQVAGRAGRAENPGRVIIQSFNLEHPVFKHIASKDIIGAYKNLYDEEIALREAFSYPPFSHLVSLQFNGLDAYQTEEAAKTVAAAIRKAESSDLQVLGPASSPLARIRGRYRFHILIKSKDEERLLKALHWILKTWKDKRLENKFKCRFAIDMQPVQMM